MAILTAAQLKASREAVEAGVNSVTDAAATEAISRAEATLNLCLGYKVANSDTTLTLTAQTTDALTLPQRAITISQVTDAYPGGSASTLGTTDFALRSNGFKLYRIGGWTQDNTVVITGTFGYASSDDRYIKAKEFVTKLAVRDLVNTGPGIGGMAVPPGSLVTSLTTGSTEGEFYTPTGDSTGYQDLDKLLDQIGRHPGEGSKSLYTMRITNTERDLTFDDILAGREIPEYHL